MSQAIYEQDTLEVKQEVFEIEIKNYHKKLKLETKVIEGWVKHLPIFTHPIDFIELKHYADYIVESLTAEDKRQFSEIEKQWSTFQKYYGIKAFSEQDFYKDFAFYHDGESPILTLQELIFILLFRLPIAKEQDLVRIPLKGFIAVMGIIEQQYPKNVPYILELAKHADKSSGMLYKAVLLSARPSFAYAFMKKIGIL